MSYKKYLSAKARTMPTTIMAASSRLYPAKAALAKSRSPFGAAMADEIFELYGNESYGEEPAEECDVAVGIYDSEEHWYQTELPLENLRELEERMRQQINKFDRAYKKMMVYALKWYYLEQDAEDNPQVEKLFKDLQMTRKLTGSDYV